MKIYTATKNENKIKLLQELAKEILSDDVEVFGCSAESNVSDTPWEEETSLGAKNRASNSLKENKDADLGVGIETGLIERNGQIIEETWCCVTNINGNEFWGYASGNVVPAHVKNRVIENKETGTKSLEVYNQKTQSFVTYSGDKNIRAIGLSNAIKTALAQYVV